MRNIQLKEKFWTFDSSNGEIEEHKVYAIFIKTRDHNQNRKYQEENWEEFVRVAPIYWEPEDGDGFKLDEIYFSYDECFEKAREILQKRIKGQEEKTRLLKEKYNL